MAGLKSHDVMNSSPEEGACDGHPLLLSAAQLQPALAHNRVPACGRQGSLEQESQGNYALQTHGFLCHAKSAQILPRRRVPACSNKA